jgi:hypothetical protein
MPNNSLKRTAASGFGTIMPFCGSRRLAQALGVSDMSHWYFVVGILFAVGTFALVYVIQSRRRSGEGQKHSWVSYLVLWPLILDADRSKRGGKFFTRREWVGWAIVGLLIAAGMFVNSRF